MKHIIETVGYTREPSLVALRIVLRVEGQSTATLFINHRGDETTIEDEFGQPGIQTVMRYEGVSKVEVLNLIHDALREHAEEQALHAKARHDLSNYLTKAILADIDRKDRR